MDREARRRVLVVDDDPFIGELIRTLVRDEGGEIVQATRWGEIRQSLTEAPPSLIILDLLIPEDGIQLLRHLKSDANTRGIPVIVLTGRTDAREMALGAGATMFLSKPFEIDEMADAIRQFLCQAEIGGNH